MTTSQTTGRQQYKGFTITKYDDYSLWEVSQRAVILEGCTSLATAKKWVRDYLAKGQPLTQAQIKNATQRLEYIAKDVQYIREDLMVDLDNVDRFLTNIIREATSLRAILAARKEN